MSKRTEVLRVPLDFAKANEFIRLRLLTKDDPPILLGRIVALALAVFELKRVKMHVAEVDAIVAWRAKDTHFADLLTHVYWASVVGPVVELSLPSFLQPFTRYSLNAKAWANVAKRDEHGRYLPKGRQAVARAREEPRAITTVDAIGNVVREAKS